MSDKHFVEELFENGYTDLISVIPPGGQLSPDSKIPVNMVGKIPGRRNSNGTWAGWNWRKHFTLPEEVKQWAMVDRANIGLRADHFPGVDIDCTDASLSKIIADFMRTELGEAPARVGREPKQLLMYRTAEGFGRMRLWIKTTTGEHLVEILGVGQQYLVHGLHPATQMPYRWLSDVPPAGNLTVITREQADAALTKLAKTLEFLGLGFCTREADGRSKELTGVAQASLLAPSVEHVREAVSMIPNLDTVFPDRTSYLKIGYAIKAAVGEHDEDGLEIFGEWASRWDGGDNDPDVVTSDWRRMNGEKSVGWNWIAEQARGYGYNDAADDFEVLDSEPPRDVPEPPPMFSDQWLAEEVIRQHGARLRYVPERGCSLVWATGRWKVDAELLAEDIINQTLRSVANTLMRSGITPIEIARNLKEGKILCSAGKAASVATVLRSNRAVAVSVESLDHDPMKLNTPIGIVDLFTGKLTPPDPAALCTKSTSIAPDFSATCPTWLQFLHAS